MKKLLLPFIFLVFNLTGCDKKEVIPENSSTFPQLKGKYEYLETKEWEENGEDNEYYNQTTITFDETNIAEIYTLLWANYGGSWINEEKEPLVDKHEWKVENGKFYIENKDPEDGEWSIYTFKYIDENNFQLDDNLFTKEN